MIRLNVLAHQLNAQKAIVKNNGLIAATGTAVIWLVATSITFAGTPANAKVGVAELFGISGTIMVALAFFLDRR